MYGRRIMNRMLKYSEKKKKSSMKYFRKRLFKDDDLCEENSKNIFSFMFSSAIFSFRITWRVPFNVFSFFGFFISRSNFLIYRLFRFFYFAFLIRLNRLMVCSYHGFMVEGNASLTKRISSTE